LNALVDEYVNLAYHGIRAKDSNFNVTIEKDYDRNVGAVDVLSRDLGRVFLNIVNNACYAIERKKKDAHPGFSPMIWVRTKDLGEQVSVIVRDNGIGIAAEIQDKIFNPFLRQSPLEKGLGLVSRLVMILLSCSIKGRFGSRARKGNLQNLR